jgi:peptidoglycan/xylan/chitin deacetylase (PgdA/CDA1 family)
MMFNHFHGRGHARGQGSISGEQLVEMVRFIGREHILPAREWLDRAESGALGPHDLCLTFDDNLRCQYDVAVPVLREQGLTAFWFVPTAVMVGAYHGNVEIYRAFRTGWFDDVNEFYEAFFACVRRSAFVSLVFEALRAFSPSRHLSEFSFYTDADRTFRYVRDDVLGAERYRRVMLNLMSDCGVDEEALAAGLWMDDARLRELHAGGHVVGLHSHTHPMRLAELDGREQAREYRANREYLSTLLGEAPVAMSHPCNSYSAQTLRMLRELGVRLGFRANMAGAGAECGNGPSHQRRCPHLEHPRQDHTLIVKEMMSCASPCSPATSLATPR